MIDLWSEHNSSGPTVTATWDEIRIDERAVDVGVKTPPAGTLISIL